MTHEANITAAEYRTEITENQFDERFTAVPNHLNLGAYWPRCVLDPGRLFEAHGAEARFVFDQHPAHVWSFVADGDGELYLESGRRPANHLGYAVTAEPVPAGEHVRVPIDFCEALYGSRPCPPRSRTA